MQAAHREKKAEEEEQRRLDLELFGEGEGEGDEDVQITTEEAEFGGELVLENPETRGGGREDTVMADAGVPERDVAKKSEEPEEPPRSAPDCFTSAPEPGAIQSDACSTTTSFSKRSACAQLDKINLQAKRIAAVVTSYSDGFVALALISPQQSEGFDCDMQSAASLLFEDQKDANKEPESAVVNTDTAIPSLGKEDELALTGFYHGRKKVSKLLHKLMLAEEPVAVISRTTSEGSTTLFVVGRQKGSWPEQTMDISHEITELQYSKRMALIEIGGNYQALDSELESLYGSDEEDVKEELSPQGAGRGNARATGGAKGRGGTRGKTKGGSKARGRR